MQYWTNHYQAGDLIATVGENQDLPFYVSIADETPFIMYHQIYANQYLPISREMFTYFFLDFRTYAPNFYAKDLQYFADDARLLELFTANHIAGAWIANGDTGEGSLAYIVGAYVTYTFPNLPVPPLAIIQKPQHEYRKPTFCLDLLPSRNQIIFQVDAIEGLSSRENLVYKMEIKKQIFPGSIDLEVLKVLEGTEAPPRVENAITYLDGWRPDIHLFLDDVLSYTPPQDLSQQAVVQNRAAMPFYITTWAEQNGVEIGGSRSLSQTLWAIKARISEEDLPQWRSGIFSRYIGNNSRWLTWQPNGGQVTTDMPVFHTFLLNRKPTPTSITVMVLATYYEHTPKSWLQPVFTINNCYENMVLNIPMGYTQLDIPGLFPLAKVQKYSVYLLDQDGYRISAKRTFYVNHKPAQQRHYLTFQNSLGGFDSICASGVPEVTRSLSGTQAQTALPSEYTSRDEQLFVRNKTGQEEILINTGLYARKWLEYLEDLAWSERILLLTQAGFVSLIHPESTYTKPVTEGEDFREFKFIKSKLLDGFSYMPLPPVVGSRPTGWLPSQPYCLVNTSTGFRTGLTAYNVLKLHYVDVTPAVAVKGTALKPNIPGAPDYVAPVNNGTCVVGTSAATSAAISRASTFVRSNCDNGFRGGPWTIAVAAGAFGGSDLADANARAEQEYANLNTQANADLYGTCTVLTTRLAGKYINYSAGNAALPDVIFAQSANATRNDVHINDPQQFLPMGINSTYYAIEHTGFLKSDFTGNVVLSLEHTHGIRLYVNNVLVINNFNATGTSQAVIPMTEGRYYQIKVQFAYRNTGTAKYVLSWGLSGSPLLLVPAYACFK
jgi:hypothetical protein